MRLQNPPKIVKLSKEIVSSLILGDVKSGKTSYVIDRIKLLLSENIPFAVLSYSRVSANTLRETFLNSEPNHKVFPYIKSVQSFAYNIVSSSSNKPVKYLLTPVQDNILFKILTDNNLSNFSKKFNWEIRKTKKFRTELREFIYTMLKESISADELRRFSKSENGLNIWNDIADIYDEYIEIINSIDGDACDYYDEAMLESMANSCVKNNKYNITYKVIIIDDLQNFDSASIRLLTTLQEKGVKIIATSNPNIKVNTHNEARSTHKKLIFDETIKLKSNFSYDSVKKIILKSQYTQDVFLKKQIQKLLLNGVSPEKIAVIARSTQVLQPLCYLLASYNIPVQFENLQSSLNEKRLFLDLKKIVKCVQHFKKNTFEHISNSDLTLIKDMMNCSFFNISLFSNKIIKGFIDYVLKPLVEKTNDNFAKDYIYNIIDATKISLNSQNEYETGEDLIKKLQKLTIESESELIKLHANNDIDTFFSLFRQLESTENKNLNISQFIDLIQNQDFNPTQNKQTLFKTVKLLTPHNLIGKSFDYVFVYNVLENEWPNLKIRNSIFGADILIMLIDKNIELNDREYNAKKQTYRDELALFELAISRAKYETYVLCFEDSKNSVSPFLSKIKNVISQNDEIFFIDDYIIYLRTLLYKFTSKLIETDDKPSQISKGMQYYNENIYELAMALNYIAPKHKLANPKKWYGYRLGKISSDTIISDDTQEVSISPSRLSVFLDCPLKWFFGKYIGEDISFITKESDIGSLIHEIAAEYPTARDSLLLKKRLDKRWSELEFKNRFTDIRVKRLSYFLLDNLCEYNKLKSDFNFSGSEVEIVVNSDDVKIKGRIDRVYEYKNSKTVVDIKTGDPLHNSDVQLQLYEYAILKRQQLSNTDKDITVNTEFWNIKIPIKLQKNGKLKIPIKQAPSIDFNSFEKSLTLISRCMKNNGFAIFDDNSGCAYCSYKSACPKQNDGRNLI